MAREIPLLVHFSALAPVLPIMAALGRGHVRWYQWLVLACLISLAGDGVGLVLGSRGINNHWVSHLVTPMLFAALLMSLAREQATGQERHVVRGTAGLLLVASGILGVAVEDLSNFSRYSLPLGSLLLLGAAVWTLVQGGLARDLMPRARPGWWAVPGGLAVYGIINAAYFPLVGGFVSNDVDFVSAVLYTKAMLTIVSFGLLAWGVIRWSPPTHSGPSSWPSSSPRASS